MEPPLIRAIAPAMKIKGTTVFPKSMFARFDTAFRLMSVFK